MYAILLTLYMLVAVALIVLVLIQHGKGADIGAAFGSGASNTVFGSQGTGGFLFKLTGALAAAFFAIALILGYWVNSEYRTQASAPVVPQSATMPAVTMPIQQQPVVPLPEDVIGSLNTDVTK